MFYSKYKSIKEAKRNLFLSGFSNTLRWAGQYFESILTGRVYHAEEISILELHKFQVDPQNGNLALIAIRTSDQQKQLVEINFREQFDMSLVDFLQKSRIVPSED